jgi:FMN phosphatase YigB (HAD superfamily)/HEPN domain-containing protein
MAAPPESPNALVAVRRLPVVERGWRFLRDGFRRIAPRLPERFVRSVILAKARLISGSSVHERDVPSAPGFDAVFDESFYVAQVGVLPTSFTAVEHYRRVGWRRNLDPSPLFDVSWYLEQYSDALPPEVEPLADYLERGWMQGRYPAPWFSTSWYLDQLARSGIEPTNPLVHYVAEGCARGLTVSERHSSELGAVERAHVPLKLAEFGLYFDPEGEPREVALRSLDAPQDLVTFDLWDTLIRRTRPADSAKVATARRMAMRLANDETTWSLFEARVDAERGLAASDPGEEYHVGDVLVDVLGRRGVVGDDATAIAASLVAAEVDDEMAHTEPIGPLVDLFARLRRAPATQVAVMSDFYVGRTDLGRIARSNDVEVDDDEIFVSCELGGSKRLGSAYRLVERQAGVEPDRHLHIGDNRWADVDRAVEHGASAVLVPTPHSSWPVPGSLSADWYDGVPALISGEMEQLLTTMTHAHRDPIPVRRARAASAPMSVVAVAHVSAAIEAAVRRGLDVVHYLSREGAFLAEVHRRVGSIVVDGEAPRAVHLEVSRRSTFGPSLRTFEQGSLSLIGRQYPLQSVRGLLTSLGVSPDALRSALGRLPIDPDEPHDVTSSLPVLEFLERPDVRRVIEETWCEQGELLTRYLRDREFGADAVVVDIGWRGTIQDNLCRLLPNSTIHGVYLGLFPYHNAQPSNATKQAVAFDGNFGESFGFADPPAVVESPLTPILPTILGYADSDGRVEPVRADEPGRADHLIGALQSNLLELAPRVAERLVGLGASTDLIRRGLAVLVESLYVDPPRGLADIWFESSHDDTFGAANVTPYAKEAVRASLLGGTGAMYEHPAAMASRWAAGYVRWTPVEAVELLRRLRSEAA